MPQLVRDESGKLHRFPDEATPQMIAEALGATYESPEQNDIKPQISETFLGEMPKANLQQAAQPFLNTLKEDAKRTPIDALKDVAVGLGTAGQNIAGKLTGGYAPSIDLEKQFNVERPSKLLQGIAEYAPFGMASGPGLLGQIGAGAAFGASEAKPGESTSKEALKGALINALTHGVFKGAEKLRPSKFFRGNLSPQELQRNLGATKGTNTSLGDVIGSPFLKRQYENILSKTPFSGANEELLQAGKNVSNRGENILSNLLGDEDPSIINNKIHDELMNQYEYHQGYKEKLYDKFNSVAEEKGYKPKLNNFTDALKRNKNVLENLTILRNDPLGNSLFEKVADSTRALEEPNFNYKKKQYEVPTEEIKKDPFTGKPVSVQSTRKITMSEPEQKAKNYTPLNASGLPAYYEPSYKEANILKGRLNKAAKLAKSSSESSQRSLSGIYEDLGASLKKDVHESASDTQDARLINAYNKAEENFGRNYSPFLDKEIYKYIGGKGDADLLVNSFLKNSKVADRSQLLSKLTNKLPGKERELVAYSYLSPAIENDGAFNPGKLNTLIKQLGKNQFKALIPDKSLRKQLSNYRKLYNMNVKGVNLMQNPATGQQNLDILPMLLGHAGTTITGGTLGGLPGALLGLVSPGLAARPLVKALTSPAIRESLVKEMLKGGNKFATPGKIQGSQAASQILAKLLSQGNE